MRTKYSDAKHTNHLIDGDNELSNKSDKRSWYRIVQRVKVRIPALRRPARLIRLISAAA